MSRVGPSRFSPAEHFPAGLRAGPVPVKRDYRAVLNLSSNELQHPQLDDFFGGLLARLDGADSVARYPYHPAALDHVASRCGVDARQATLSAGSDDAIRALMWIVAPSSRTLVLQTPNYGAYAYHAQAAGVSIMPADVFGADPDERLAILGRAVAATPRACVVITDPDPVEGVALGVERLAELAHRCAACGSLLVVDATYAAFAGIDHAPLIGGAGNVLVVRSYSKSHGLAGLRAAVVLGAPEAIAVLARWRSINTVSSITLALLVGALEQPSFWAGVHEDVGRWRDELSAQLRAARRDWSFSPSVTNFVLVDTGAPATARDVAAGLEERGVVVKRFEDEPALGACLRITVPPPAGIATLLAALQEVRVP